jgi:hypothetical protein
MRARAPASASGPRRSSRGSAGSAPAARTDGSGDESWARLLRHLADAGPSELEDLQTELALTPKELKGPRVDGHVTFG